MRGPLAGLVLGFALGMVVAQLTSGETEEADSPPSRPPTSPETRSEAMRPPAPNGEGVAYASAGTPGPPVSRGRVAEVPGHPVTSALNSPATDPHPEKSWSDAELVTALRTLAGGGSVGLSELPLWAANRVSVQIWSRYWTPKSFRLPAGVVEALLESEIRGLRGVGASLLVLAEPPMIDRIPDLARSDSDPAVRQAIAGTLDRVARENPHLVDVLTGAAGDPSPLVRTHALNSLANLVSWRPGLGEWVAAGTRDPDPNVREYALGLLRMAGPAGASRATEMLLEGDLDLETLETLLRVAVHGSRIGEILDRRPRAEVVTALIAAMDHQEKQDLSALAGRFEELLPLYQPGFNEEDGYAEFFGLAVEAGETGFLREVMASSGQGRPVRLGALSACLSDESARSLVVDGVRAMLRDRSASARFREAVLDILSNHDEPLRAMPALRELVREAATTDPSLWVRSTAKEILRALDGR